MSECCGHGSYTAPVNNLREKHCEMKADTDILVASTCDSTQGSKLRPQDRSYHTGCLSPHIPLFTWGFWAWLKKYPPMQWSVNYQLRDFYKVKTKSSVQTMCWYASHKEHFIGFGFPYAPTVGFTWTSCAYLQWFIPHKGFGWASLVCEWLTVIRRNAICTDLSH